MSGNVFKLKTFFIMLYTHIPKEKKYSSVTALSKHKTTSNKLVFTFYATVYHFKNKQIIFPMIILFLLYIFTTKVVKVHNIYIYTQYTIENK